MMTDAITLMTSDGHTFQMDPKVLAFIGTIERLCQDIGTEDAIPVPNVNSKTLAKVLEYANTYVDRFVAKTQELKDYLVAHDMPMLDKAGLVQEVTKDVGGHEFFAEMTYQENFEFLSAGCYLDFDELVEDVSRAVGGRFKGKTPEEIRADVGVKDDPEEAKQIRLQNNWAFV